MASWAKPLLIGLLADGLRALTSLCSNLGLEGGGQLDWASGYAMRLNSRTGREGSPVSSIQVITLRNKDTWVVMSGGC